MGTVGPFADISSPDALGPFLPLFSFPFDSPSSLDGDPPSLDDRPVAAEPSSELPGHDRPIFDFLPPALFRTPSEEPLATLFDEFARPCSLSRSDFPGIISSYANPNTR